jgi:hypothetical protein
MKIGLFDHVEDGARPVAQLFESGLNSPPPPTKPAFIACMSPSTTPRL